MMFEVFIPFFKSYVLMITKVPQRITVVRKIIQTCFSKGELSYVSQIGK